MLRFRARVCPKQRAVCWSTQRVLKRGPGSACAGRHQTADGFSLTALGGWTCCVAQRNYGHRARKRTWLYAVGCELPSLVWGDGPKTDVILRGGRTGDEVVRRGGMVQNRLSHAARKETPEPFRDLLLSMARSVSV